MNELVKILMERDGLTERQAISLLQEAKTAILEAIAEGDDPQEVWDDYVGLEPDYIPCLL